MNPHYFLLSTIHVILAFQLTAEPIQKLKPLPIGRSSFHKLIQENNCYVDKTEYIHQLLTSGKRCFFIARPRQCGRTLFLSTLEAIFEGRKDLFADLAIAKSNYNWQTFPVLSLNFFGMRSDDTKTLEKIVCRSIESMAKQHGITINTENSPAARLKKIVQELAKKYGSKSIVLLVDEYEKPLLNEIANADNYHNIETSLKKLYDVIAQCNDCWRFVFISGLTKLSKYKFFSDIHDLYDISEKEVGSNLFYFSANELRHYFEPYLQKYAQIKQLTLEQTIDFISMRCGGYNFTPLQKNNLMMPRSVLYHLQDQRNSNYFFEGCTPSFLIALLKYRTSIFPLPNIVRVSSYDFEHYDCMLSDVALYAAGYLTLEGFDQLTNEYLLKIPNTEVTQSLEVLRSLTASLQPPYFKN